MNEQRIQEHNNELDIKEENTTIDVKQELEVEEEVIPSMDEFNDILNQSLKKIYPGDILSCTVISVTEKELLVNIGYISDGIIPVQETFATEEENIKNLYHEGDTLKAEVIKSDDGDGNVVLSIKKAEALIVWDELQELYDNKQKLNVKVKEVVKGGVICDIKGVRAFIPASLLSTKYVENLNDFVGKILKVIVTDFNKENKKVVLSRKDVEAEENAVEKNRIISSIKKNDNFTGTVVKLMNYGAFVDIGGIQGLIRNQDLSWSRVKHPSEVVKEGDVVEVYVMDVDQKNEKISLGLKDVKADPWDTISSKFIVGNIYTGQVERITTYGAFVKIGDGVEGLLHVSEISEKRVTKPQDVLNVGDEIKVKILEIDKKEKRIKLSMKDAEEGVAQEDYSQYTSSEEATTSLNDVFKVFLKDIGNE